MSFSAELPRNHNGEKDISGAGQMVDAIYLSVIVPVYNDAIALGKCLASIYHSNYQTYEVIVVDDASTDNSAAVAQSFGCKLIELDKNSGVAAARNVGAESAAGAILVFIDSDVVIEPETLAKFAATHEDGNVSICTSQVYPVSLSSGFAPELLAATWHYIINRASDNPFSVSTMAFSIRRKIFSQLGGFNTTYKSSGGEEFEIAVPIRSHGYTVHFDRTILVHHHYQSFWARFKTVLRRSHVYGLTAYQYRFGFDKDQGTVSEVLNSLLALIGFLSIPLMIVDLRYLMLFLLSLLAHLLIDGSFYRYLQSSKSSFFAVRAVPVHFAWYFAAGLGVAMTAVSIFKNWVGRLLVIPELFLAKTPPYLILFVTSACNANCRYCFSKAYPRKDMSRAEIERISKRFRGITYLTYSGGEPSLRPDIVEITRCFYVNNNVRFLNFITNGFETDDLIFSIEQILRLCPNMELMVSFSLDGIGRLHDEIRQYPGGFDRLISSVNSAKALQGYYRRLSICTITTYCKDNEASILDSIDFVRRKLGVPCYLNYVRGADFSTAVDGPDVGLYLQAEKKANENNFGVQHQSVLFRAMYDLTASLIVETKVKGRRVVRCHAGRKMIGIRSDGMVVPCEMLPFTFGNISRYDYDISQAMGSADAVNFFDFLKQNRCHCTWECAMTTNIVFSWRIYPRLIGRLIGHYLNSFHLWCKRK